MNLTNNPITNIIVQKVIIINHRDEPNNDDQRKSII
jgi:hypothetical protein